MAIKTKILPTSSAEISNSTQHITEHPDFIMQQSRGNLHVSQPSRDRQQQQQQQTEVDTATKRQAAREVIDILHEISILLVCGLFVSPPLSHILQTRILRQLPAVRGELRRKVILSAVIMLHGTLQRKTLSISHRSVYTLFRLIKIDYSTTWADKDSSRIHTSTVNSSRYASA